MIHSDLTAEFIHSNDNVSCWWSDVLNQLFASAASE